MIVLMLDLLRLLYVLCAALLALYAAGVTLLLLLYLRRRHDRPTAPPLTVYPKVVVQLPVYNEPTVIERLIDAVAALDYPADCLTIQVLDDSTDVTSTLAAAKVAAHQACGVNIVHLHRENRAGFKAGALAEGMEQTDAEFAAIFDADFVPSPDFLSQTLPHLSANPHIGAVQTRWGHLNATDSLLTRAQAMALDAHFTVEQVGRARNGLFSSFGGTGGVWRTAAIRAAGGWSHATLTEDLDLSYRAQLCGWQIVYLPDIIVPGEIPASLAAYRRQQARWARGCTRCLLRLTPALWRAPRLTLAQRVMGTLHLAQYLTHPMMLGLLLLTPLLLLADRLPDVRSLGVFGIGAALAPLTAAWLLGRVQRRPLWLVFPALVALGTGMAWSCTRAVVSELRGKRIDFLRTPKRGDSAAPVDKSVRGSDRLIAEGLLAAYALFGVAVAWDRAPGLVPYLAIYAVSLGGLAAWGWWERRKG
jgi:cellulose synthase/poly-beta-1,6-N-acetylglucosamine synthase-like glycosyltransferase